MSRHSRACCLLLPLCLLALAGDAQAASAGRRTRSMAVLEVKSVGTFDHQAVAGLSAFVASEAARSGLRVVAGSDLSAVLGVKRQQELLGCAETACIAEIGGALGVDYLLAPEVSEIGGVWLLTVALLDTGNGRALARVTRRAEQQGGLVGLVPEAVAEALRPMTGAVPAQATAAGQPQGAAATGGERGGISGVGLALDAAALVFVAGGAACHYSSLQAWDRARALRDEGVDYEGFLAEQKNSDRLMYGAGALYVAGALALGTGLYFTFLGGDPEPVLIAASPAEGGGLLTVWRRF